MDARQLFALGAHDTGMLSLALQLTPLCLGAEDAEQYVFVRAANATAVPQPCSAVRRICLLAAGWMTFRAQHVHE